MSPLKPTEEQINDNKMVRSNSIEFRNTYQPKIGDLLITKHDGRYYRGGGGFHSSREFVFKHDSNEEAVIIAISEPKEETYMYLRTEITIAVKFNGGEAEFEFCTDKPEENGGRPSFNKCYEPAAFFDTFYVAKEE